MRKIKFRGKTTASRGTKSEWIYGDLIYAGKKLLYIRPANKIPGIDRIHVISDSVGQYTGVDDNDGKEIYEGDIISCPDGDLRVIEWVEEEGSWKLRTMPYGDYVEPYYVMELEVGEWLVVGNIYDNPKMAIV